MLSVFPAIFSWLSAGLENMESLIYPGLGDSYDGEREAQRVEGICKEVRLKNETSRRRVKVGTGRRNNVSKIIQDLEECVMFWRFREETSGIVGEGAVKQQWGMFGSLVGTEKWVCSFSYQIFTIYWVPLYQALCQILIKGSRGHLNILTVQLVVRNDWDREERWTQDISWVRSVTYGLMEGVKVLRKS